MGTGGSFEDGKTTGRLKYENSLPSSTEFKNEWIGTSQPPACRHDVHRDSVTFYFYVLLLPHRFKFSL